MLRFKSKPTTIFESPFGEIASFMTGAEKNIDKITADSFGEEWSKFDSFSHETLQSVGDEYFDIITEEMLPADAIVLDLGCGTGRWSLYVAERCAFVESVDPSEAVFAAKALTHQKENIRITQAASSNLPFEEESFDFVFSLGVLHHIPDTFEALKDLVAQVKNNGWCMVYLYYALDNQPSWYKAIFKVSDFFRKIICRLPGALKRIVCDLIAVFIYGPFVLFGWILKTLLKGDLYKSVPLSYYINKSFNVIRNDALDRFGTPLEQRFTKDEIQSMMERAGLKNIIFSDRTPYWHAVGQKKEN